MSHGKQTKHPPETQSSRLSRRERELMDLVYQLERATASEIRDQMASPPSYSAVRATLRILEHKGHLQHHVDGPRYVYLPTVPPGEARQSALAHLVRTFFGGSSVQAAAALLDLSEGRVLEILERPEDALVAYRSALLRAEELVNLDKTSMNYASDLETVEGELARLENTTGTVEQ